MFVRGLGVVWRAHIVEVRSWDWIDFALYFMDLFSFCVVFLFHVCVVYQQGGWSASSDTSVPQWESIIRLKWAGLRSDRTFFHGPWWFMCSDCLNYAVCECFLFSPTEWFCCSSTTWTPRWGEYTYVSKLDISPRERSDLDHSNFTRPFFVYISSMSIFSPKIQLPTEHTFSLLPHFSWKAL